MVISLEMEEEIWLKYYTSGESSCLLESVIVKESSKIYHSSVNRTSIVARENTNKLEINISCKQTFCLYVLLPDSESNAIVSMGYEEWS